MWYIIPKSGIFNNVCCSHIIKTTIMILVETINHVQTENHADLKQHED